MYLEQAVVTHAHLLHYLLVDKFQGKWVRWLVGEKVLEGRVLTVLPDFDLQVQIDGGVEKVHISKVLSGQAN